MVLFIVAKQKALLCSSTDIICIIHLYTFKSVLKVYFIQLDYFLRNQFLKLCRNGNMNEQCYYQMRYKEKYNLYIVRHVCWLYCNIGEILKCMMGKTNHKIAACIVWLYQTPINVLWYLICFFTVEQCRVSVLMLIALSGFYRGIVIKQSLYYWDFGTITMFCFNIIISPYFEAFVT